MDLANNGYLGILILGVLAAGFLISGLLLAILIGPKRYSKVKDDPFECGTVSNPVSGRHGARFYLVAMTFIVFDVEIIFLYPWALNLKSMGAAAFWAMMPFLALLALGLYYEWRRGVLDI